MQKLTFLFILLAFPCLYGQETVTGKVLDLEKGTPIDRAGIVEVGYTKGVFSKEDGSFKLGVTKLPTKIKISFFGYRDTIVTVQNSSPVTVKLSVDAAVTDVVVITDELTTDIKDPEMGKVRVDVEQMDVLPAFLGERDVVKTLQLMPGIQTVQEGGQGFYVRGGGPDQNLMLLDNAPLYNVSHLFGFFSVFNAGVVNSVELTKGTIPAKYGGKLASVLSTETHTPNLEQWHGEGSLGLIATSLTAQGPIKKDVASIMIGARRSYVDLLLKPFINNTEFGNSGYYFWDVNAKLHFKLGEKDVLNISTYLGGDQFQFKQPADDFLVRNPWGNRLANIEHFHTFSDSLFVRSNIAYTEFKFSFESEQDDFVLGLKSGVQDIVGKTNWTWLPHPKHTVEFGGDYIFHIVTPTAASARQDTVDFITGEPDKIYANEAGIYISDSWEIHPLFQVYGGLRYSFYIQQGPFTRYNQSTVGSIDSTTVYAPGEIVAFYQGLEPRVSGRFSVTENISLKAGVTYNTQYMHLASMTSVSLPTDIWLPSTEKTQPQRGWQSSLGYYQTFHNEMFEYSIEGYYKSMTNVIEYKDGAIPEDNINDNVDNLLTYGIGRSYGVELFFKKRKGQFTGWVGYTFAFTERQFNDINDGNWFPAKYDRRHDLSVVLTYALKKQWTFSAVYVYSTGNAITLPTGRYFYNGNIVSDFPYRNSNRMANYHRLDISATWDDKPFRYKKDKVTGNKIKVEKKLRNSVNISVYNVYNRQNPYFIYFTSEGNLIEDGSVDFKAKQVSLFPIIPSVAWIFKF